RCKTKITGSTNSPSGGQNRRGGGWILFHGKPEAFHFTKGEAFDFTLCEAKNFTLFPQKEFHKNFASPTGEAKFLLGGGVGPEGHVVVVAFYDGDGGYQGQLGLGLEILEVGDTAVAHGGLDLVEAALHIVVEAAGVGHVGVHALLKAQLGGAAQVVAL